MNKFKFRVPLRVDFKANGQITKRITKFKFTMDWIMLLNKTELLKFTEYVSKDICLA